MSKHNQNKYIIKKIKFIFLLLFLYFLQNIMLSNHYPQDNITLVTAFFNVSSPRHKFNEYLIWINNLLQLNISLVFFIDKSISVQIKYKRPKIYEKKTIWIENDLTDLYSYKHFKKEFSKSFLIDKAKYKHSVPLFIVWAEKLFFLKKTIFINYFKSKCFYWIDAGYFREKNMSNYLFNWPSIDKCNEDPRVIINGIRKFDDKELNGLKNFNYQTHDKFMNNYNIAAGLFGGQSSYILKFVYLYYKTIKLFIRKKKFIGSEQNLYTFIGYLHKDIVKVINSGDFYYFKDFLSNNQKGKKFHKRNT